MALHDRVDPLAHLFDHMAEVVALVDVHCDNRLPLGVLAGDEIGGHLRADLGDFVKPHLCSPFTAQHQVAQIRDVVALRLL